MNWLVLSAGVVLVLLVLIDVIWTTMWIAGGAGPVTRAVGEVFWRVFKLLDNRSHSLMLIAGPFILSATIFFWLALLWAGWFVVFLSDPTSVLATSTDVIADISDRVYFAGYTVFTLGNGDFSPNGDAWQTATVLATASGLFTATLAVTYVLSAISAAVSARSFATTVDGLGPDAAGVVAASWNGENYSSLSLPLQSLGSQLSQLSQQYLAYPVIQYFHSSEAAKSPMVAMARLDQIVAVSAHGVPRPQRMADVSHNSATSAIEDVLEALPSRFTKPADHSLPAPNLVELRAAGLPVSTDEELAHDLQTGSERRKKLVGLLNAHGWKVEDV